MRKMLYIFVMLLVALPLAFATAQEAVVNEAPATRSKHYDGIDVSSHQRDIDWRTTASDKNIQYVYVKATEGRDYVSRHYEINVRNARKHGVKVGSYHFLRTGSSIRAQFENFRRTVRKEDQDLIPLIDVEVRNGWTDQQVRDSVKAFADLVEDYYGCKPMIYTSVSFYNKILGKAFANYPLFIARYAANPPVLNGAKWTLWQFSEKGRIAGIDSHVDLSCFNKGCSLKDITYRPGKNTRRNNHSVTDEVDRKAKPDHVSVGAADNGKVKESPKKSKRQEAEEKKKAEKERKAKERAEKMAKDEAKKKAEADRKAKEKQERLKQEEQKRLAKEKADKEAKEAKAERKAKAQQAREQKAKERKAAAEQKKKSGASSTKQNTKSSLLQSQRNDSVRTAKQQGRKINKSSADND